MIQASHGLVVDHTSGSCGVRSRSLISFFLRSSHSREKSRLELQGGLGAEECTIVWLIRASDQVFTSHEDARNTAIHLLRANL